MCSCKSLDKNPTKTKENMSLIFNKNYHVWFSTHLLAKFKDLLEQHRCSNLKD
jgi:hypothetical protein